jgi:hypothetical protein
LLTDIIVPVYCIKCKNNKKERLYYIFSYKFAENKKTKLIVKAEAKLEALHQQRNNKENDNKTTI